MRSDGSTTLPAEVQELLAELLPAMQRGLRDELLGVYLFGSVALDAYTPGTSDVDLLACLRTDPDASTAESLRPVHDSIVARWPQWRDRVEVAYVGVESLARFREQPHTIARICPGEPLHLRSVDVDWLVDWHVAREHGRTLLGPPARRLLPRTTSEEFRRAVATEMGSWVRQLHQVDAALDRQAVPAPGLLAYLVLGLARGLRTARTGEHVSKEEGARWVARTYPRWASLAEHAVAARRGEPFDPRELSLPAARAFARFVQAEAESALRRPLRRPAAMRRRALLAAGGGLGAALWALQQPLDKRVFGADYDDVELLGRFFPRQRCWRSLGLALHVLNGAIFGLAYSEVWRRTPRVSPRVSAQMAIQMENVGLFPLAMLVDRHHPAREWLASAWGARQLAQATWRHAILGVVLGEVAARLARTFEQRGATPASEGRAAGIRRASRPDGG